MSDLPSVTVVVPTYNRVHMLERVLRPLLADPAAAEVLVVVDGGSDGSLELVEGLAEEHPRLRGLRIANSGDMGARDAGARAARHDVVLFIDDDVVADPGLVTGHARRHAEGAADVVVGYMPVRLGPRRRQDFALRLYARAYEGRCAIYESDGDSPLRDLWGGNFSMRREDCLRVGMANPRFTEHYHADRDFGLRCVAAGLRGVFDRSLSATHLHQRELDGFLRDYRSQGAARIVTRELHPDSTVSARADEFTGNLPGPLAAVVAAGRRPRGYPLVSRGLISLIQAAGVARAWAVQEYAARLLGRIEMQRGALDQAHGRRA